VIIKLPSHLALVPQENAGARPSSATARTPAAHWMCCKFVTELPFDQLHDAAEFFLEHTGFEPDTLYVHPHTKFWLSFVWSNFDLDGEPEPAPFWVDLDELHGMAELKIVASEKVPPGWWHLVVSKGAEADLEPWSG